jgi:hypothetical protein
MFVGLIKFFSNEEYLDQLISGIFYCNTPEYYRLCALEGVGDNNKCCMRSFRKERGDAAPKLTFGGHEISGLTAVTMHVAGQGDMWLHCWTALEIVDDADRLRKLAKNLNKLRSEFGHQYVFLPKDKIKDFVLRLQSVTNLEIHHGKVSYSSNHQDWSVRCKSEKYLYQSEYRFVVGRCKHTSLEPLILKYESGFSDLLSKNGGPQIF